MKTFRSNGKLLVTAEYVVLDGAKALAIPTKSGQSLKIKENVANTIVWKSYDENGIVWFENEFSFKDTSTTFSVKDPLSNEVSHRVIQILKAAHQLNPEFLRFKKGYNVSTYLEFNRKWGLGTSSTLINNIAKWANIDAYQLLEKTFGGSGYDIACAQHNTPIAFQLQKHKNNPFVESVQFNPSFKDSLYFVYLNEKQNSRDGIKAYKTLNKVTTSVIREINSITEAIVRSLSLSIFEELIIKHEQLIGELINETPIKSRLFSDYNGTIKSLGAWGGDFVLATSETNPTDYFKSKGFDTIIPYNDMVL
jgi:mevalonate kinase